MKRLGFWGVYLLVTILVIVALLELGVRVTGIAPQLAGQVSALDEDPYLPYRPKPNTVLEGRSSTDEYDYRHVHNRYGFRDVDYPLEKPDGVFRILGLGDSFTMGWGAEFDETYLRRLETRLNERPGEHPRVEIIKAGISGFFPESERLLLEHYGLDFEPDLVLVGFVPNDLYDTYRGIDAVRVTKQGYLTTREAEILGEIGVWFYRNLQITRIPLKQVVRRRQAPPKPNWAQDLYREGGVFEDSWGKVFEQYERMIELSRGAGAEIAMLHIPTPRPGQEFERYPGERLGRWLEERGVTFVDTLPALEAASATETLYWARDGHCTPAGYRVIADTLFDALTSRGIVP